MVTTKHILTLVFLISLPAGCDAPSAPSETPDLKASAPTVLLHALDVSFPYEPPGLQFFITPTEDLILEQIVIQTPTMRIIELDVGSRPIMAHEALALQDEKEQYERLFGVWLFTFMGSQTTPFTFTLQYTVYPPAIP